ncbi:hypothetical protein nbrc107697_19850 [Gordonia crocea]|uniref:Uncharacterized protein n=1 Tax=Gordonia crocea TaxID=589162 RepID=A0A7I9UYH5_9ACTN|nr:hypothetical protein nbrc107697_19850 [Gordonia crocea]
MVDAGEALLRQLEELSSGDAVEVQLDIGALLDIPLAVARRHLASAPRLTRHKSRPSRISRYQLPSGGTRLCTKDFPTTAVARKPSTVVNTQ